ncbi:MAG: hypothetical protein ABIH67_04415 [Candidatus Uhrbacteria bacterium]
MDECAESLINSLKARTSAVPVMAVAYSMGGHILRIVADIHPEWFDKVILLACFPHTGMTVKACWNSYWNIPGPFTNGSLRPRSGSLKLTKVEHVRRFLFHDDPTRFQNSELELILEHCRPEPSWPCFQLGMTGFRQPAPPLQIERAVAWIPEKDNLSPHRSFPNEPTIAVRTCSGGHGFVFSDAIMRHVIDESIRLLNV